MYDAYRPTMRSLVAGSLGLASLVLTALAFTAFEGWRVEIANGFERPDEPGRYDVYPIDQTPLLASGLPWTPRPVVQSHSAYTPMLADMNAAHLAGPDHILLNIGSLDDRYPTLDDGPRWPRPIPFCCLGPSGASLGSPFSSHGAAFRIAARVASMLRSSPDATAAFPPAWENLTSDAGKRERDTMKAGIWLAAAFVAGLLYLMMASTAVQGVVAGAAIAIIRPMVIPIVELINVPSFVYCAALMILLAGLAACAVYHVAALRPALYGLRRIRSEVGDLPEPRVVGASTLQAWTEARHALGQLLQRHGTFVAAWSAFQAESLRGRGVPSRPFSSFVTAEPSDRLEGGATMRILPGYFTSVGLILTFVGLVVALYFAAKGFRSGDTVQAKAAIVELLNAASFKFLTSVAALISAFIISLYGRFGEAAIRGERQRALARIEAYLATWRDRVGVGGAGEALAPADLLKRFDALLATVSDLARDVKRVAERNAGEPAIVRDA